MEHYMVLLKREKGDYAAIEMTKRGVNFYTPDEIMPFLKDDFKLNFNDRDFYRRFEFDITRSANYPDEFKAWVGMREIKKVVARYNEYKAMGSSCQTFASNI